MKCELLAPAGNFQIAKRALYEGADALYLATERFGARAYAKNLSLDELDEICKIAHVLNKKIYVTVNTLIKDEELDSVKEYLNKIYFIGVDGIIATDLSVIKYILECLPDIECHISTQVGVKNLADVKFFEKLGVNRTVLARETSIDEIKKIKENSKMPLEVFIHGALCVSYSGNCYMSSLLTLRSGNRGRCAQNCRYLYNILEDDKVIGEKANYLAMKDLNSFKSIPELKRIGVDSLKIEGRMKDETYVANVVKSYRNKLDNSNFKTDILEKIFHREYTAGFLANTSNGDVVNSNRPGNVGELIGTITYNKNNEYILNLNRKIAINDRIRINYLGKDNYYNITSLLDKNRRNVSESSSFAYISLPEIFPGTTTLYKMKNQELKISKAENYKLPLSIYAYGEVNKPLVLTVYFKDEVFNVSSDAILLEAKTNPLSRETLFNQLEKFSDTPFYLDNLTVELNGNLFMVIKELNELRRKIISTIYQFYIPRRTLLEEKAIIFNEHKYNQEIIVKCHNNEQVEIAKKLGIKTIYGPENFISYTSTNYSSDSNNLLIASYGALYHNDKKDITTDYEFNIMNASSLAYIMKQGANHVTLSKELSYIEIKNLVTSFISTYGFKPNVDLICYGKMTLMTLKYCPIKHIGKCPGCKNHHYALKDDTTIFPLLHDKNCTTYVLNAKATNLIDELELILPFIERVRLDFTNESVEEVKKIISEYQEKINNLQTKKHYFDSNSETRAYFKRKIM